jgi:hypothetical protein
MKPNSFFRIYILSLLLFNLTACASMQTVSIESAMQYSPPRGVDYGSLVEVKTLDKHTANFRVTEIGDDGIGGSAGFYRFEDMKSLRVENKAKKSGDTWGIILGALGMIALIAVVANADSVAICTPSPCPQNP